MSIHIPIHALRYVVLVAETRSYKISAQQAHRTQPALSLAITQSEKTLGQPVFEPQDRTRLTSFGVACLPPIKDLLDHHQRTTETLRRISTHEYDTVTLACVPTASTHVLPSVIPKFSQQFPSVEISLLDDNSKNIETMVLSSRVDFGLCSFGLDDPRLHFEPLMQDRYGIICAKHHAIARRKQLRWNELGQLPLIGSVALEQLKKTPELSALPEPKVRVWNMMSLLAMIEKGNGVTILGALTIPPSYSDRIAFVPITGPILPRELGILRLARKSLSLPSIEIISLIRAHIKDTLPSFATLPGGDGSQKAGNNFPDEAGKASLTIPITNLRARSRKSLTE